MSMMNTLKQSVEQSQERELFALREFHVFKNE
jgi:hypothetical protein